MTVGVSKGGIPKPPTVDELLELDDASLGARVVSMMSVSPRAENFEALGRVIKWACCATKFNRDALELALLKRRRR